MVLIIGVAGHICSGKSEFVKYLHSKYQFTEVAISEQTTGQILKNLEKIFALKKLELSHLSGKQFKQILKTQVPQEYLFGKKEIPSQFVSFQQLEDENKHLKLQQQQLILQQSQSSAELDQASKSMVQDSQTSLIKQANQLNLNKEDSNTTTEPEQKYNQHINVVELSLQQWYREQIINPIRFKSELDKMRMRNFFHLISIESPIFDRWERFQTKYPGFIEKHSFSLEHFIALDDFIHFHTDQKLIIQKANFSIFNNESLNAFKNKIERDILKIIRPFRPSWDQYFMTVAYALKSRSNCMKQSTGAVLVNDQRIVSTGYNGTPQNVVNCYEIGCEDCNTNFSPQPKLDKCICLHAEEAAILEAGVQITQNCTLYTTTFPCIWCAKCIIQAQIKKVYYHLSGPHDKEAREILESYVVIQQTELTDLLFHIQ